MRDDRFVIVLGALGFAAAIPALCWAAYAAGFVVGGS
jgi:hypothetical protein